MSDLPEGWSHARLGDISLVALGKMLDRAKRTRGTSLPYLRNANVQWDRFALDDVSEMPFEDEELERYAVRPGDLLVCEGGEPGRAAVWTGSSNSVKYQEALLRVRTLGGVCARWVLYSLRHNAAAGTLDEYFTGSTIKHFPQQAAITYELKLPPVAEQRRIVEKVEALLARVNAARDRLAKMPGILKRFRQSVLAAACSGKLTADWRERNALPIEPDGLRKKLRADRFTAWVGAERLRFETRGKSVSEPAPYSRYRLPIDVEQAFDAPPGWAWASLDEVTLIVGGITKGQRRTADEALRRVTYLRVANVQRGYLDLSEVKEIEATEAEVRDLRLCPGDILLNEGGDIDKLGRGWVWNGEIEDCIHQNHVFRARPVSDLVDPRFVSHYANTFGQHFFVAAGAQTVNLASVSMSKIKRLPVPVPPVDEQREIVMRVHNLFALADTIERRVTAATARADRLTQAIMAKAFRGELVPTEAELSRQEGRDYEPASVLLERVRAGRAAAGESKSTTRTRRTAPKKKSRSVKKILDRISVRDRHRASSRS
jgi:type I restriction enzyme S subunit